MVVTGFVSDVSVLLLTPDPASWYFSVGVVVMLVLLGLTGFAFYTSLGGKSPFSGLKLEEV